MTTGEIVRKKRLEKKLSLRKLANKSGVALTTIYRLENNEMHHHKTTLLALADVLECPMQELLGE